MPGSFQDGLRRVLASKLQEKNKEFPAVADELQGNECMVRLESVRTCHRNRKRLLELDLDFCSIIPL